MLLGREDYNRSVYCGDDNKIKHSEPCFLLRAQDKYAYDTVLHWSKLCESGGGNIMANCARRFANEEMFIWSYKKQPDMDSCEDKYYGATVDGTYLNDGDGQQLNCCMKWAGVKSAAEWYDWRHCPGCGRPLPY